MPAAGPVLPVAAPRFPTVLGDETPKHKGYVGVNEDQTATGQGNKIIPTLGDETPKHKGYVGVNEDQAATGQGNKTIPTLGLGKVREVFYAQDISREDALALQSDLMLAFNAPAFQRQLHDFARQFEKGSAGFRKALLPLVRSVQLVVIPRYGFEKSEAGVEAMLRSFKSLQNDLDIQVNNLAIQDLLNPWTEQQLTNVAPLVHRRPSTKFRVLDLLQAMLKEFGKASFQRDIGELKKAANFNSRRVFDFSQASINFEDPEGYFELEGREDLALIVQQAILPGFGFEASKEGVKEMMRHCAPFFQDPEVADLLDAINSKLGMSASACKRFRALRARSDAK